MKKILPLLTVAVCLSSAPLTLAQDNNDDNASERASNNRFWEAQLPGGSYMVELAHLTSVSIHTYHVKGAVVHEVAIETMGAALTRIYAIQALGEDSEANVAKNLIQRGRELSKQAGERAGVDLDTTVHKEYPLTTHAKTIEFRVVDKADLDQIYDSLTKAWRSGRGRKVTIK